MNHFSISSISGFLLIVAFTLSSCYRDLVGIEGSGPDITQTRTPGQFDGVDLSIDATVILHDDSNCRVEIQAQSNIAAVISTDIRSGRLQIGFDRCVLRHHGITIHLYGPHFNYTAISGSGEIRNDNALLDGNFTAKISGSGRIELEGLDAQSVETQISGSGNITAGGQAQSLHTRTSGSGDIHAFNLLVQDGDVDVSGSGKTEINASQNLTIDISGSGDVYYKNTPAIDVEISGSGHVYHVN